MRIPIALSTMAVLCACAQPYSAGRLAPRGVPGISDQDLPPRREVSAAVADPASASTAEAFPPVAMARVDEAEVIGFLAALRREHGDGGLRALGPGTTLAERLRYCTSRVLLGAAAAVMPELRRLSRAHPESPIVWRQLAQGHYWQDEPDAADACLRRAYELDRAQGFTTCPSLPSYRGQMLLGRETTRDQGVALLRHELAEGPDFIRAVWALATDLRRREAHHAALACIDAARVRAPENEELVIAKAQVCVELHDPDTAVDLLGPIVAAPEPDRFALETMLRAHVLRQEFAPALAVAERLLARADVVDQEKEWLRSRHGELAEAAEVGFLKLVRDWQVFAILRGHEDARLRVRVLRDIVRQDNVRVREHALKIAFHSDRPILRAEALRLLLPHSMVPLANVRAGLADPHGSVRATAATLAGTLDADRDRAAALVLEFMAKETDGYAFRQMHGALQRLTGREIELPFGAVKDAAGRDAIVAEWRRGQ